MKNENQTRFLGVDQAARSASAPEARRSQTDRLLKITEVAKMTALGRATIYVRIKEGSFPVPVQLGERAVAWKESEVQAWISGLSRSSLYGLAS